MEKRQDDMIMKARSYRSILTVGMRLYTGSFRKLFKASWQMVLLFAVTGGALGTLSATRLPDLTTQLVQQYASYGGMFFETIREFGKIILFAIALLIIWLATMTLAQATVLAKLKEHKETGIITMPPYWHSANSLLMARTMKGFFATIVPILLPFFLFFVFLWIADMLSPQFILKHIKTVTWTFCIYGGAIIFLSLPLSYVLMKYIMESPCGYWRTLVNNYNRGLRHWGMLFLVYLVSSLIIELVSLVIGLPTHILSFANQQAHTGVMIGDPLGMPSYITWLTFITYTLCMILDFYVSLPLLIHNYYAYGSIETQEKERQQQLNEIE